MALKNNRALQSALNRRDRTHSELVFNREFPSVQDKLIDQKNLKKVKQRELKAKKKLLPMEIAALPAAERNEVRLERELAKFDESQSLPRRAVKQEYQRRLEKSGEAAAESYRTAELKKLDDARSAKVAELEKKYPTNVENVADSRAVAAYEKAEAAETAVLTALSEKLEKNKVAKVEKTGAKLAKKNEKLQAKFDAANQKIGSLSPITEEDFGKDTILSIRNLKMYFSGIKAVDDLSFDIKKGEIFGLIGPNGAGKTTVFNCITQFYHPTGGDVYYRDPYGNIVALNDYKTTDVIKSGIVRTFQNIELVYWLSVLDNLLLGVHAFYRSSLADQFLHTTKLKREDNVFRQRAISILERLGIAAYKDMPPMGLPYGVLKKVELARTLMSNPRMIILDEPAAGLNDAETEDLTEIIRVIRDDFNCTIFLVEHDMNLVMNVCDTVCAISFGKLLAIGTPEQIQNDPLVQEAYLGTE